MRSRATPFGHILVLERGEELLRGLTSFARREGVESGFVSGIGAVGSVELGIYLLDRQDYLRRRFEGEMEVCSLAGNIALLDGEPFAHVHGVFGFEDFTTVGGHVFEAVCSITLELAVHASPDAVHRGPVDFCNLKLIRLEDRP